MATRRIEIIDGIAWSVYEIVKGETINDIKREHVEEPWMNRCFVPTDQLYDMTFRFEPISGNFVINGFIDGGPVEVIGNINNMI